MTFAYNHFPLFKLGVYNTSLTCWCDVGDQHTLLAFNSSQGLFRLLDGVLSCLVFGVVAPFVVFSHGMQINFVSEIEYDAYLKDEVASCINEVSFATFQICFLFSCGHATL